jgi:hypothetical protein
MGALDDAIREHLELKRQHGASENEIREAEAEALGPARRDSTIEPFVDEGGMTAPFEPFDDEPPPLPSDAVEDAPPPPPPDPVLPDRVPLDPASLRAAPVEHAAAEPPPVEPAPVDDPVEAPPPGTPKPHGDPAIGDEDLPPGDDDDSDRAHTAILDDPLGETPRPIHHEPGPDEPPAPARPAGAEPPAGPDDDVLEETPDFLQETPEHDRLWFEQKPPRDFDFDD